MILVASLCRLLLLGPRLAFGGEPHDLKPVWVAAGASSQTMLVADDGGVSLLSLVNTGATRSLVRVDAASGRVQWQSDVVPGVGWGSFEVLGDDVIVQGVQVGASVVKPQPDTVALLSLSTGLRRWTRDVPPGSRLAFGAGGGLYLTGDCAITLLDPRGADLAEFPGVRETLPAAATPTSAASASLDTLCVASPRLLGLVRGRSVVLVPEKGAAWRLDAIDPRGAGWTAQLGTLQAPPEVDWRTGMFWVSTKEGLVLTRYNLDSWQIAWRSVRALGAGPTLLRAVDGPLGAPAVLIQAGEGPTASLTLINPHDGRTLWQVDVGAGDAIVLGESFGLPEWIQPSAASRALRWVDANGAPVGAATVPPQSYGIPVGGGVLARNATAVSFIRRDGGVGWSLPMANPRWALLGDLLVVAPELGDTRLVVQIATGTVLGRFTGGEAIGSVTLPGTANGRLVFVQSTALEALKVTVAPVPGG